MNENFQFPGGNGYIYIYVYIRAQVKPGREFHELVDVIAM
jgi:hypothetical protein